MCPAQSVLHGNHHSGFSIRAGQEDITKIAIASIFEKSTSDKFITMNKNLLKTNWRILRPLAKLLVHKYQHLPEDFYPRKILAVRIQGAGDVLLTTPALRSLRHRFPEAEIHYLVGELASEIVKNNSDVDVVISVPETILFSDSMKQKLPLMRRLRAGKYDLAVIFSRSAGLHAFISTCKILFRVGIDKNGSGAMLHLPVALTGDIRYEALDYLELVGAVGGTNQGINLKLLMTPRIEQETKSILKSVGLAEDVPYGVLSVGGGRNAGWEVPQKRWKLSYFAELSEKLDIPMVIVGDSYDRKQVISDFTKQEKISNLCGKLSLMNTAAVIKHAKFLVTNDTVTLHFAVAMETLTVALFGPTHPKAILPEHCKKVHVIQGKLPCVPCFWQGMPAHVSNFGEANFPGCPISNNTSPCLDTISPTEVLETISNLMVGNRGRNFDG
jgi:ADP-heptose:LPS heptosyltransferase